MFGALGTFSKRLEKGTGTIGNQRKNRNQREYWEESWTPVETCCHSNSREIQPDNAGVKNSNKSNDNVLFVRYIGLFLQADEGKPSRNGPENKKNNDHT